MNDVGFQVRINVGFSPHSITIISWTNTEGWSYFFYYEQQIKRELKKIHISGCRCNERLKAKIQGSKRLTYTRLRSDCARPVFFFLQLVDPGEEAEAV